MNILNDEVVARLSWCSDQHREEMAIRRRLGFTRIDRVASRFDLEDTVFIEADGQPRRRRLKF